MTEVAELQPTFELDTRELARIHPGWFAYLASQKKWMPARHLRLLADELVNVATGETPRLIINLAPRHGKSTIVSKYFAAWYLSLHPQQRIIFASYADGFARKWGAAARDAFYENGEIFGVTCNPKASAGYWEILANEDGRGWKPSGGYMKSVGIGAGLTGYGAEVVIVDDPVKDYREAASAIVREAVWHWFNAVLMTRLQPNGAVVIIMTRWHHDDLVGRLLEQDRIGEGENWKVINLPALAEQGGEPDMLGRRPGEALWPEAWSAEKLRKIRKSRGSYIWSALYQGRPTPLTGGMFNRNWFEFYTAVASGDRPAVLMFRVGTVAYRIRFDELTMFATVDLASSTKTSADYTVVQVWGYLPRGARLFLLDQERERVEGPEHVPMMWRAHRKWDLSSIWVEQVNFELSTIADARRKGLPVRSIRPKGDKVTRALPATAKMEGGLILFPSNKPKWWDAFETELLGFPKAKHDDVVDCLSYSVQAARRIRGIHSTVDYSYGGAGNYGAEAGKLTRRKPVIRLPKAKPS
ncbi:hypothetical protein LCGC14_0979420 [marine sediment metagenome]|uniref:Terminase large subunit gp17-like C-terminal domain-containing protein n=1 Tax=marine sediment metagenome TaxID=412755 RepID=A0A0F9NVF9_9ZZZZ